MNLHDYFIKVLDDLQARYEEAASLHDLESQTYYLNECGDYNESYIIEEALQRLEEIKALREVAKIHDTFKGLSLRVDKEYCMGCGYQYDDHPFTPNIKDCPILLPLVRAWARGRDDLPEYLT